MKKPIPDLSRTEIEHLIHEWVFNERDRAILSRRLLDGLTFDELAFEFDLSPQGVKHIVYKGQDKIFKHI